MAKIELTATREAAEAEAALLRAKYGAIGVLVVIVTDKQTSSPEKARYCFAYDNLAPRELVSIEGDIHELVCAMTRGRVEH